jgi:hypothetical protein
LDSPISSNHFVHPCSLLADILPAGMWGGTHSTLLQPVIPSGEAEQQAGTIVQYGLPTSFYTSHMALIRQIHYHRLLLNLLPLVHCQLNHLQLVKS